MDTTARSLSSLKRLRAWCIDEALPYWAEAGFDRQSGAFQEKIDLDGAPVVSAPRRTFVQARQIYVFAQAAKLGWFPDGAGMAIQAALHMIGRHWAPDGKPGWVFSIAPDGAVADATRPAYTQAFALFGLAWAFDISGDGRFLEKARETIAFLDANLAAPGAPGFRNSDLLSDRTRQQNPQMHLFEAFLAWYEITRDETFLGNARDIFNLFETSLFEPRSGTIPEYLDESWRPATGETGRLWEPGHSLEWVWLLRNHARLSGDHVAPYVDALLDRALRSGMSDGVVINRLRDDGTVIDAGARAWPQTEALKALAVEHEAGRAGMREIAATLAEALYSRFLGGRFPAGWRDNLDADGALTIDFVPASTFYHVMLATAEIDRVFLAGEKQDRAG